VTFIDESQALVNNCEDDSESENMDVDMAGASESPESSSAPHVSHTDSPQSSWTLVRTPRPASVSSFSHTDSPFIGPLQERISMPKLPPLPHDLTRLLSPGSFTSTRQVDIGIEATPGYLQSHSPLRDAHPRTPPPPSIYLDKPVWPLTDPAEALLLRHYVQNLAIWVRCSLFTKYQYFR